jgi:hypothetical protein
LAVSPPDPSPGARCRPRFHRCLGSLTLLLVAVAPLAAQEAAVAELRGQVLANGEPSAGALVVVHRVGPDVSGPLDSLRAGRDGGFRFRLPAVPDPASRDEVFFASVEREGVNYFGPLVQTAVELDSLYVIRTYDTTPAPLGGAALAIPLRVILLEEVPNGGGWTAADLIHVAHTGDRTIVAAPGGATFVYPLPEGATDLEIGGTQMSPDAATLADGSLRVTSAIPPGEREFVVRYRVPDPYLTLRYAGKTAEAELLVKEPAPPLDVQGLQATQPIEDAGVSYRRFAAANLTDATIVIREGKGEPLIPTRWLAVGLALVLASAALFAVLRPHPAVANAPGAAPAALAGRSPLERRQRLLLEVARLDEARDAGRISDADEWAARRRALLERVRELG